MTLVAGWLLWIFSLYVVSCWIFGNAPRLFNYLDLFFVGLNLPVCFLILLISFIVCDWNKLHLVWCGPATYLGSTLFLILTRWFDGPIRVNSKWLFVPLLLSVVTFIVFLEASIPTVRVISLMATSGLLLRIMASCAVSNQTGRSVAIVYGLLLLGAGEVLDILLSPFWLLRWISGIVRLFGIGSIWFGITASQEAVDRVIGDKTHENDVIDDEIRSKLTLGLGLLFRKNKKGEGK